MQPVITTTNKNKVHDPRITIWNWFVTLSLKSCTDNSYTEKFNPSAFGLIHNWSLCLLDVGYNHSFQASYLTRSAIQFLHPTCFISISTTEGKYWWKKSSWIALMVLIKIICSVSVFLPIWHQQSVFHNGNETTALSHTLVPDDSWLPRKQRISFLAISANQYTTWAWLSDW